MIMKGSVWGNSDMTGLDGYFVRNCLSRICSTYCYNVLHDIWIARKRGEKKYHKLHSWLKRKNPTQFEIWIKIRFWVADRVVGGQFPPPLRRRKPLLNFFQSEWEGGVSFSQLPRTVFPRTSFGINIPFQTNLFCKGFIDPLYLCSNPKLLLASKLLFWLSLLRFWQYKKTVSCFGFQPFFLSFLWISKRTL